MKEKDKEKKLYLALRAIWFIASDYDEALEVYKKYEEKITNAEILKPPVPSDMDLVMLIRYDDDAKKLFEFLKMLGKTLSK